MGNRRYSIYSIKDGGERRARGISELRGQESTPWTHKSFVYKRRLISQAGRRGFESRLPLHLFNHLCARSCPLACWVTQSARPPVHAPPAANSGIQAHVRFRFRAYGTDARKSFRGVRAESFSTSSRSARRPPANHRTECEWTSGLQLSLAPLRRTASAPGALRAWLKTSMKIRMGSLLCGTTNTVSPRAAPNNRSAQPSVAMQHPKITHNHEYSG